MGKFWGKGLKFCRCYNRRMDVVMLGIVLIAFLLIGSAIVVTTWRVFSIRSGKGKVLTALLIFLTMILAIALYGYFFVVI